MRKLLKSDRYLSIYSENPFTYEQDVEWMKERLKKNNTIYILSGEANHNLHNPLKEPYKNFLSDKSKTIKIQAGPIISVPETIKNKSQEERAFDNVIIRLASDKVISFYPRVSYSPDQYRVFREENLILLFDPHEIYERTDKVWFLENADSELNERVIYFNNAVKGNGQITERFSDKLIFLTTEEIAKLKNWASIENIDLASISYKNCKKFLNEILNKTD